MQAFMLYSYVYDIVLFSYNLDSMQNVFDVLETFNQINELTVDMDETKMMAIKAIQLRHYPTFYTWGSQYTWRKASNIII